MPDRIVGIVWADYTGRTRLTIVKAATNPCAIMTQAQAKSNAEVLYNWDSTIDPGIGSPVQSQYQAANQSVTLSFGTATGAVLTLTLPAPQIGIFLADKTTVDQTQIASLIAACIGNLSDGAGNVATAFIAGSLDKSASGITPIG